MEVSLYGMDGYTISDDGKIYSLDYNHTGKKKELVGYTDKDGYRVILIKIRYIQMVSRLRDIGLSLITSYRIQIIYHKLITKTQYGNMIRRIILNGVQIHIISNMQVDVDHLTALKRQLFRWTLKAI